jgi:hypothetical protein
LENGGEGHKPPHAILGKFVFFFFFKLENTKPPPLSPLSSHFGILAKGRGSSATWKNSMACAKDAKGRGFEPLLGTRPKPPWLL